MKIESLAPTRISLFGGGTDVEPFASQFGGATLSFAINIRQHVKLPEINAFPQKANPNFYKTILKEFDLMDLPINCRFDGIIESGLGSSAAGAVALVGAINKYQNLGLNKDEIACKAWEIEVNKLGLFGGKQDQYAAVYGGFNYMEFGKKVSVLALDKSLAERIKAGIVLIYTGKNRIVPTIQEELKILTSERIKALIGLRNKTQMALRNIGMGDIEALGQMLDEAWILKKSSNYKVTTPEIDMLYEKGKRSGAWGGKLLGSGGGGHMIFMVDPLKRNSFLEKLEMDEVDFSIDYNGLEVKRCSL